MLFPISCRKSHLLQLEGGGTVIASTSELAITPFRLLPPFRAILELILTPNGLVKITEARADLSTAMFFSFVFFYVMLFYF